MNELLVAMSMRVRFRIGHGRIARNMHMLMMLVVHVRMIVLHHLVAVRVLVPLADVQPDSNSHQRRSNQKRWRRVLAKDDQREHSADERRGGEVCSGARGAELSKR
jgi:hypothetical protein